MRGSKIFAVLSILPLVTQAANIVLSNDDSWVEINIRKLFQVLTEAGENVVLSAPAENKSGTGSADAPPTKLTKPCEYNSCPAGSPPYGHNASNPRLNYVNSFPVTSMRYGIEELSTPILGGPPDLALSGFNVGANTGITTSFSGTVGAACEAVKLGYPAIALSGSTGSQTAWNAPPSTYQSVYADLSLNITQTLLESGVPYLPVGIWLNVNFSPVSRGECTKADDFGFVLSRIYPNPFGGDIDICGNGGHLPTESTVMKTNGCWVSVSVAFANTKLDAGTSNQVVVLNKLEGILTCLPREGHWSEVDGGLTVTD